MKLHSAATYFDRMECVDAYTLDSLFNGQFDLFDDSKRDGSTVTRRIMATKAGPTLPDRGVISVGEEVYILGKNHKDWFDREVIREKFVIFPVVELVTFGTEEQALLDSGSTAYGGRVWVKNLKEAESTSEKFPVYNIYLSITESVNVNQLVFVENRWHRVLSVFESAAGFLTLESAELDAGAVTSVTLTPRTGQTAYNPATDSYTAGTPVVLAALVERPQTFYDYESEAAPKSEPGDIKATFLKSEITTVTVGSRFPLNGKTYEIISAVLDGTAWHTHARWITS